MITLSPAITVQQFSVFLMMTFVLTVVYSGGSITTARWCRLYRRYHLTSAAYLLVLSCKNCYYSSLLIHLQIILFVDCRPGLFWPGKNKMNFDIDTDSPCDPRVVSALDESVRVAGRRSQVSHGARRTLSNVATDFDEDFDAD